MSSSKSRPNPDDCYPLFPSEPLTLGLRKRLYKRIDHPIWSNNKARFIAIYLKLFVHPYYFWSGLGAVKSRITEWQDRLQKVMAIAGIEGGHFHRFRDTCAVRLLSKGKPIEMVARLLGITVKVCLEHYSPWCKVLQDSLTEAVSSTWA
jgi:integrase